MLFQTSASAQSRTFSKDSLDAVSSKEKANNWLVKENTAKAVDEFKLAAQKFAALSLWSDWYQCQGEAWWFMITLEREEEVIKSIHEALKNIAPQVGDPVLKSRILNWLGYAYYTYGDNMLAEKYYLMQCEILENAQIAASGEKQGVYPNYAMVGIIHTMTGDHTNALSYLEKAESIYSDLEGREGIMSRIYWNKGLAFAAKRAYGRAIDSYLKAVKYGNDPAEADTYMGMVYLDKGELVKAMNLADQSIKAFAKRKEVFSRAFILKGSVYNEEQQYEKALYYLQKGVKSISDYDFFSKREYGETYMQFGEVYEAKKDYDNALLFYQKALKEFIPSFQESEPDINPDPEMVDIANGLWVMEALVGKGNVFLEMFEAERQTSLLELSVECYDKAFQIIDKIRIHQRADDSKIDLIGYAHPMYEKALNAIVQLYETTGNEKFADMAFAVSQKTKAFILASTLQNINAREAGGVPDSLIRKEASLRKNDLELRRRILKLANNEIKSINKLELDSLKAVSFEVKRELQKFLEQLEKTYPEYYRLKYEDEQVSIKELQNQALSKDMALIDYFLGENSVFILTVTNRRVDLTAIERTVELNEALAGFIGQVSDTDYTLEPDYSYQEFTNKGYFLYDRLLKKPLGKLNDQVVRLVIIPDGILNQLPFESLISEQADPEKISYSFDVLSYLIEKYTISYHYTPRILLQQKTKKSKKRAPELFAGFAADFSNENELSSTRGCGEMGLSPLQFNQYEVQSISESLDGARFLGPRASVESFLKESLSYQILHLATHACANEGDPLEHKIFFANDEYITMSTLFNLPLVAEMVVLSACETGIGKIVKGEGVMSLARGVSYTGCPSVIMSLWSVQDKASADIMIGFYEELKNGNSKDIALRSAKLNYLKEQKSIRHHPSYWAAFVPIGDISPISDVSSGFGWGYFLGFSALAILLFVFVKKVKKIDRA